jgi:hypothetical protein
MNKLAIKYFEAGNVLRRGGARRTRDHWEDVEKRFRQIFESENEDHLLAARFHDLIEDGIASEEELRESGVSEETIRLVKILTHGKESYEDYIEKIKQDKIATQIKIADIIDNLSDKPTLKQIEKYSRALFKLTY